MTNLNPSMRIKVKRDTFFVPDRNGGVYFRNNIGSFHMEGEMVDQWIEKLLPMFNGEYTLRDLTDGLTDPYRDRVFEIAEVLRSLHAVCRDEKKVFLPAIFLHQVGMAGPLVQPDSDACWESALRRLHQSTTDKDPQLHTFSSTAAAMLSNVIVFDLLKWVTGVNGWEHINEFFLLDLETLEGHWHSFLPHPLVNGRVEAEWVQEFEQELGRNSSSSDPSGLLPYFSQLTSAVSGILHIWDEGDLKQLPLAQCRVQAVDLISKGPAALLTEMICNGLTHDEARREAGLAGIEMYVSRRVSRLVQSLPVHPEIKGNIIEPQDYVGVGAGETVAEGVCRRLQTYLEEAQGTKLVNQNAHVFQLREEAPQ